MGKGPEAGQNRRSKEVLKGGDSASDPVALFDSERNAFVKEVNRSLYDSSRLRAGFNRVINAARKTSLPPEDTLGKLASDAALGRNHAYLSGQSADVAHFGAFHSAFYVAEEIVRSPKNGARVL